MDIFGIEVMDLSDWEATQKFNTPIGPMVQEVEYHEGVVARLQKQIEIITSIWANKE